MIVYRKKVLQIGASHERRHPLENGGLKITTFVPLQFKRRGVRKVVVAPANVEDPVTDRSQSPSLPSSHDSTLLRALGRGIYWQPLLDTGVVADTAEIAPPAWLRAASARPPRSRSAKGSTRRSSATT